jgi:hypothetical protein
MMSRRPDTIKVEEWNQRIARFRNSSQSVVDFCRAEGVSQPSFYQWKKKLGSIEPGVAGQPKSLANVFEPVDFKPVQIAATTTRQPGLKVRLPGGIELELGDDPKVIESVIKQLIESALRENGPQAC